MPPAGFVLWTGPGSYKPGTVAVQVQGATCTKDYSTSAGCWALNIVTEFGCPNNAFVNVNMYDARNMIVDTGIDEIPYCRRTR